MVEKLGKKSFAEFAEEIAQKKGYPQPGTHGRRLLTVPQRVVRRPEVTYWVWSESWRRIAGTTFFGLGWTGLAEEVGEVERGERTVRAWLISLSQELERVEAKIDKLLDQVENVTSAKRLYKVFKAYLEEIKSLDIVRQVFLSLHGYEDVPTLWTIIESEPFEDSLRTPIYEAQMRVLKTLTDDILVDFRVLNVRELSNDQKLEKILPVEIIYSWHRG